MKPPKRQYPDLYEKVVPVALGVIGLMLLVILLIILAVVSGVFSAPL